MSRIAKVSGACLFVLSAMTAPVAAQANVAGSWTLIFDSPQYPAELTAVFAQDGRTVTGEIEIPEMVEAGEMSDGVMEGNKLTFLFHVSFEAVRYTLEVEAEVDGDTMEGSASMAEMGSFPFRGKRVEG